MALAELVKNSYDADATVVTIDYKQEAVDGEQARAEPSALVIEDDGNGMTLKQLREGWMHIGTADKEREPLSPRFKRPRAGIKGVGRFAAQRLGHQLCLETTPIGSNTTYTIKFNWGEFSAGRPLDSIVHEVQQVISATGLPGTRLSVTGLYREWEDEDLADVIKDLSGLHVPPSTPPKAHGVIVADPGFEVVAAFHGEEGVETVDELDLLRDERVMHLHGEVDQKGAGFFDLEFYRPEHEQKQISYKNTLSTGPLTFDVDLALFSKDWINELGVRRAQRIGRKHGGVRIWRDGFRVFPYGLPGDDWLGVDQHIAARRPPLNLWRNQGILGGVRISRDENPQLLDLLTRRGMVETAEYDELRTFVFEGLVLAAQEHAALSARKTRSGARKAQTPSEALGSTLAAMAGSEDASHQPKPPDGGEEQPEIDGQINGPSAPGVPPDVAVRLVEEVRRAEQGILNENQMLKVLASLGTGLAVFAHEMKTVSLDVAVSAKRLDQLAADLPPTLGPHLQSEASQLRSGIESLTTYARYIEDFVAQDTRIRRQPMELSEFLNDFFAKFKPLLDRRKISCRIDVRRGLWMLPVFKAELISIYFNLMTNAVKALLSREVTERRIGVFGTRADGEIVVVFADTGCGVPEGFSQELFEPFVTRSHDPGDASLGRGTGLGLYIVREIVSDYNGEISLVQPPDGYVTGIEVRLPARRVS